MTEEQRFESRPATEGAAVSVVVDGTEQTIEAKHGPDGWTLTPENEAQAAALARFSDSALQPEPAGYAANTVKQLQQELARRELLTTGKKDDLIERLEASDAEKTGDAGDGGTQA